MAGLEQVAQSLWIAEGDIVNFYSFAYPTRCVIVRLDSGALWVWSPVELTERLRREVEALGPVTHLVSPNKLHHLYLASWRTAFPGASLWGPASTIRRHTKWTFQPPLDDHPPSAWTGKSIKRGSVARSTWMKSCFSTALRALRLSPISSRPSRIISCAPIGVHGNVRSRPREGSLPPKPRRPWIGDYPS